MEQRRGRIPVRQHNSADPAERRRRTRKPRGRGLRTKTGCLTCRKRHKKCDEVLPTCGPCSVSSRQCVFPATPGEHPQGDAQEGQRPATTSKSPATDDDVRAERNGTPTSRANEEHDTSQQPLRPSLPPPANPPPRSEVHASLPPVPSVISPQNTFSRIGVPLGEAPHFSCSPADTITSETWTTDLASTRWLGLLATDAAQADSGFSLAPSPERDDLSVQHEPSFDAQALANGIRAAPQFETAAWQSNVDATLTGHEAVLFRHFAERSSRWLDLFDPQRHFSTYAIRLALRNTGLMKAILALSAKHRARSRGICPGFDAHESATEAASAGGENEWIGYYYETLHYLSEALAYKSYTNSEELLATAITISAYEMLDESDGQGNWQRHLKGVFWIQRSQDVHGASGGLRQSVWWAWLRQDLWAAFRERRHCLSFWVPVQDYAELDQHAMANRAIYLLSQAVNYCADARGVDGSAKTNDLSAAMKRRPTKEGLLADMTRWKSFLGAGYKPLPTQGAPDDVFTPMWVHPPQFGVALQAYSFALILVTLHSPHSAGFDGYLKMQRTLSGCVDTICGIAMELRDEGCQILSAQCLYGAGLCVQDRVKRDKILSLMEAAEQKVGWTPMATWRDDLRREWARVDKEHEEE